MNFENATKQQLIQIIFHEDCELDLKYQALDELQLRKVPKWKIDNMLDSLLRDFRRIA